jgi:hypothetical protein
MLQERGGCTILSSGWHLLGLLNRYYWIHRQLEDDGGQPSWPKILVKKILHHTLEQEKYGFGEVVDEFTYWGAYYCDAVLAAAHALAAAKNRLDGEEVLKELRYLSLDNTNTGVLEMDANGDRRRAQNPVFYVTSEGEAVQFALYDGNLDILQDPL